MKTSRTPWIRAGIALFLCLGLASGCGRLRSEFFRGETTHLLDRGNRHYRSGEFQEAGDCYRRAAALDPDCARAHAALGHVAYVRGRFQEASRWYERAVDLDTGLEATLAPLILDARRMKEQQALEACGARFQGVLELLASGREDEVEALLSRDVSAAMLARHATSLSTRDRDRLLKLAEERALSGTVPTRCALFYGHLLAADERHGFLATRLLETAAKRMKGEERQKAWMTLAALYVRLGRENDAAWAYEAALEAGCPREEVLPLIARLYGMPVSAVAPEEKGESEEPNSPGDEAEPSALCRGTLFGSLESPLEIETEDGVSASHEGKAERNRSVPAGPSPMPVGPPSETTRQGQGEGCFKDF